MKSYVEFFERVRLTFVIIYTKLLFCMFPITNRQL